MRLPNVLVTAAAGNTGRPTVLRLLEQGYPVRALVRRTDDRSEALRREGADVVVGSLDDISDVRRALDGVQRAYFCPPLLPGLLAKATIFAASAEEQRLEFVVAISQWLAHPSHPAIHTREAWLAETVFARMRGVASAFVNPGWFADNYLAAPDLIVQFGLLPMPLGAGLNAPPSNEDIARVVAAMLTDPAAHQGKTYRPTGPTLLSPQEIAATFASVLGRPVRYLNTPIRLFGQIGRSLGLPDYTTAQVLHYFADYQRNAFGQGAPTNAVLEIGGRPPETFETIVRRYLATPALATPALARRTLGAQLRAAARLTRGMLRGPANLEVIARTKDHVLHTVFAADSAPWRETHHDQGQSPPMVATLAARPGPTSR